MVVPAHCTESLLRVSHDGVEGVGQRRDSVGREEVARSRDDLSRRAEKTGQAVCEVDRNMIVVVGTQDGERPGPLSDPGQVHAVTDEVVQFG